METFWEIFNNKKRSRFQFGILNIFDWQVSKYDDMDILDSLAINILPKAGYRDADLSVNPRYMPENDPVLQKEVERLKKQ